MGYMSMRISLQVLESNKEISVKIANALLDPVKTYMKTAINEMKQGLPNILYGAIVNSPEYAQILGGRLRYELGIANAREKLEGILQIWTNNVQTTYVPPAVLSNGQIKSEFSISLVKSDYSDVLQTSYAEVQDNQRGYTLPWLKWLLLDGSVPIVQNHSVIIGRNSRSRTGMAVMKESSGKNWSVPKQFAGTSADNWITRAIGSAESDINTYLEKIMKQ